MAMMKMISNVIHCHWTMMPRRALLSENTLPVRSFNSRTHQTDDLSLKGIFKILKHDLAINLICPYTFHGKFEILQIHSKILTKKRNF